MLLKGILDLLYVNVLLVVKKDPSNHNKTIHIEMSDAIISYASFILADAGLEITSDNLQALTKAAGANVENVC